MTSSSGFEVESVVGKLSMREQRVSMFMFLILRNEMRRGNLIVERRSTALKVRRE